jgi:hypothetical protein
MVKNHPPGSVQALSSSASSIFALGMAFLGYWGFSQSNGPWKTNDAWVIVPLMLGFLALLTVPWLSTAPLQDGKEDLQTARTCLLLGTILIWAGVLLSFFIPL